MARWPESHPHSAENTPPVQIDPARLVQNVYTHDGQLDTASQGAFSQYLVDRMYGAKDEVSKKYTPGAEIPAPPRLVFDSWRFKRTAAALTVVCTLAANVAINGSSIVGKTKEIVGDVAHEINPEKRTIEEQRRVIPGKSGFIEYPISTSGKEQKSGQTEDDTLSAKELVDSLAQIKKDSKIKKITITGNSSDEWAGNGEKSIGRKDSENKELALSRAKNFRTSVKNEATKKGLDLPDIRVVAREKVISDDNLGDFLLNVQKSDYGSVIGAISAYNRNDSSMSQAMKFQIKHLVGAQRKGVARVEVAESAQSQAKIDVTPAYEVEVERKDERHPIIPIIIPIPPIPRFRRESRDPFVKTPNVRGEPLDKVWVELYEEAQQKKGELVENAWALTRKYQYLLREERVTQALRYDYTDMDGNDQNINVLFVDRDGLEEGVLGRVNLLMRDIAMMQKGKVAENLDTVVIFPSEHTGPQRPDKIGLGIDEQYAETTLGVAIPSLGLVEVQLPKNPTPEDMDKFKGFSWTLAHEVAGHFTDVNNETARRIDPTNSKGRRNAFTARDPWLGAGDDGYASTARRGSLKVQQFSIPNEYPGEEVVVDVADYRLTRAKSARLRNQAPTKYGDTDAAELHAETAAQVTTGIGIPASEAGVKANILGEKGYQVDAGLEHHFVRHVGASEYPAAQLIWSRDILDTIGGSFRRAALDGVIRDSVRNSMSERAKQTPYQDEKRRIKILTRARD